MSHRGLGQAGVLSVLEGVPVREIRRGSLSPGTCGSTSRAGAPRGRGPPLDHRQDDPPLERQARQPPPPPRLCSGRTPPSAPRSHPPRRRRRGPRPPGGGPGRRAASRPSRGASTSPGSPARLEELPRLRRREHRRRALGDDVLRTADRRGGVHREDLADDEPVAGACGSRPSAASPWGPTRTTARNRPRHPPEGPWSPHRGSPTSSSSTTRALPGAPRALQRGRRCPGQGRLAGALGDQGRAAHVLLHGRPACPWNAASG